jgi:hypothetical protein
MERTEEISENFTNPWGEPPARAARQPMLTLYLNKMTNHLIIDLRKVQHDTYANIEVYNSKGSMVRSLMAKNKKGDWNQPVSCSYLPEGVYTLRIMTPHYALTAEFAKR